jgi:hypothetical protein
VYFQDFLEKSLEITLSGQRWIFQVTGRSRWELRGQPQHRSELFAAVDTIAMTNTG